MKTRKCPVCAHKNPYTAHSCDHCKSPLDGGATHEKTVLTDPKEITIEPGDYITEKYRVIREIGQGGMGIVYLVEEVGLNKRCALKLIHPQLVASSEALERFKAEVTVCREMNHPAIIRVFEFGWTDQKHYFFTMEYLQGHALSELLAKRKNNLPPFSVDEIEQIFTPLLKGLAYAHKHTVHRDIKPDNIMVCGEFPDVTIKMLDFGIARTMSPSRFMVTRQGMGTAYYMAPEQAKDAHHLDHRADLYSIGIILYEMLTGQQAMGRFKPLELETGIAYAPLDPVIDTALVPNPEERYDDASRMLTAIKNGLQKIRRNIAENATKTKNDEKENPEPEPQKPDPTPIAAEPAPEPETEQPPEEEKQPEKTREKKNPAPIFAGLAVLLLVAGFSIFFLGGGDKPDPTVVEETPPPAQTKQPAVDPRAEQLAGCEQYKIDNAWKQAETCYRAVLEKFPDEEKAQVELDSIYNQVAAAGSRAFDKGDLNTARKQLVLLQSFAGAGDRAQKLQRKITAYDQQEKKTVEALQKLIIWAKRNNIPEKRFPRDVQALRKITALDLRELSLTSLPEEIGYLTNLQVLVVYKNKLTALPKNICKLNNLKELYAADNSLTSLPEGISELKKLTVLNISKNLFTSLTDRIGELTNLEKLYVGDNNLTSLPDSIVKLTKLEELGAGNNKLTTLPDGIGKLANLKKLWIYKNKLTRLPEEIGNLAKLAMLNCNSNKLTRLPESIGKLTNLEELYIGYNKLTTLPDGIGKLANLKKLWIYKNKLTRLPESIGNLAKLAMLNCKSNKLTRLPESIGKLTNLEKLIAYENLLTALPKGIGGLVNLKELWVHTNKLTRLPESIGKLTNLEELYIGYNKLTTLPEGIEKLKHLKKLYVVGNNFTSLPDSIRQLPKNIQEKLPKISQKQRQKKAALSNVNTPVFGKPYTDPTTGMEFVYVRGGCFQMGDTFGDGNDDEKPVHEVCLDDFWIGKYEVTIDEYRKYLQKTGETSGVDWANDRCPINKDSTYSLSGNKFGKNGRQPMVVVSWHGAVGMANWMTEQGGGKQYRLPTEAEWEYAARSGGKKEKYAGGNNVDVVAWYNDNSGGHTHEVGTKQANGLGIYDMSGNIWEWCSDWYGRSYYKSSPHNNPQGPSSGWNRVLRGGSWLVWRWHSVTDRHGDKPGDGGFHYGFRLVLSPDQ